MPKILRKYQKQFAENAGSEEIAEYGSLAAGSPVFSTDPDDIQSLAQFTDGWFSAVLGANAPAMEDENALFYLAFYQLCYLFQAGVPEYNAATTYYINSLATANGRIYMSVADDNVGNALTDATKWMMYDGKIRRTNANTSITIDDQFLQMVATAGDLTVGMPAYATIPLGQEFTIKNESNNGYLVTISASGAENIDGSNTLVLRNFDSVTLSRSSVGWDIKEAYYTQNASITQAKLAPKPGSFGAAAPVGSVGVSNSSGSFTTSSTSAVDVTNLSQQITTLGRPVRIQLQPALATVINAGGIHATRNSTALLSGTVFILRDGVAIASFDLFMEASSGNLGLNMSPAEISYLDVGLAAGTYTYKIQVINSSGSQTIAVNSCQLVVYEI